jgi:anti-sigma B factor antagonist
VRAAVRRNGPADGTSAVDPLEQEAIVVPEQAPLQIYDCDVVPERDHVRVVPSGELDLTTTPLLDESIRELRQSGFHHVILDLRDLEFIDSSGLRLILDLDAVARADSLKLDVIAGRPEIQRVFEIAGVLDALPFSSSCVSRGMDGHNRAHV